MAYEQKDGQGSLFKNDKDGVENRPDLKGSITIAGKQYWLSAWTKEGDKGKWLSLSAQPKDDRREPARSTRRDDAEQAPW